MARFVALISALIGVFLTTLVWADALPSAKPEDVGLSSERLARATQVLKAEVARGQYPGAVALVQCLDSWCHPADAVTPAKALLVGQVPPPSVPSIRQRRR